MQLDNLPELALTHITEHHKRIKLIVSDIEGCLNLDERSYDFEALAWIRTANQLARSDNVLPFITVCSGRQHAFVEAITRLIGGTKPAIFENGCGLLFPTRQLYDEYEWHPSLGDAKTKSDYGKVQQIIEKVCTHTRARKVIGKEILISLHPTPEMSVPKLYSIVNESLAKKGISASVTTSASAVDIAPVGIDKGSGLRWLVDKSGDGYGPDLSDIAGIGDSLGDLPLLQLVGFSSAPANASDEVKAEVDYCSRATDGQGVVDIIKRCVSMNLEHTRMAG